MHFSYLHMMYLAQVGCGSAAKISLKPIQIPEVESLRTSWASRTHFKVLGLEASSPRKLPCPRLEDSTIFLVVESLRSAWKTFWKTVFSGDHLKIFSEDLFLESTCAFVLGPWPWPWSLLSLASRGSVLGRAVLGLGFEPYVLNPTSVRYFKIKY